MKNSKIALYLVVLGIISITLQLYHAEFQIPVNLDNLDLLERAFAHSKGNFDMSHNRNFGWSLFITPFLLVIDSDNFFDYSNLVF